MYIDRQTDRPTYAAFYLFRILFDLYRLKGMLGSTMKSPEDSSLFPFLLKILVALILRCTSTLMFNAQTRELVWISGEQLRYTVL